MGSDCDQADSASVRMEEKAREATTVTDAMEEQRSRYTMGWRACVVTPGDQGKVRREHQGKVREGRSRGAGTRWGGEPEKRGDQGKGERRREGEKGR